MENNIGHEFVLHKEIYLLHFWMETAKSIRAAVMPFLLENLEIYNNDQNNDQKEKYCMGR